MSKAKKVKASVHRGAGKVASAIAKVYESIDSGGNILTQVCKSAAQVYKGAVIPKPDLKFIAQNVARLREWTPASGQTRMSEVRKILRVYDRLPEAIAAYTSKHDTFTWHTAVKLARCLNREPSLKHALALMEVKQKAAQVSPLQACGKACHRLINLETTGGSKARKFQDAVQDIAESMGIPNVF